MTTPFPQCASLWPTLMLAMLAVVAHAGEELLVCGGAEVYAFDVTAAEGGAFTKTWSWRAQDRPELPAEIAKRFGSTDDCRPVAGGAQVMISSSGGACALVERPSGLVRWYAQVPNAHGLELLPRGRIVCASSTHAAGDRLMLFATDAPDRLLWETPLKSAHGVVWDARRERLWALGFAELRRYALADWDTATPSLRLEATFPLPDDDGHDLSAVPGGDDLVVTTHAHVLLFDRRNGIFRPHPDLADLVKVKGVTIHPRSGRLVYVQAEGKDWWGTALHLLAPAGTLRRDGERLYRPRWMTAPD